MEMPLRNGTPRGTSDLLCNGVDSGKNVTAAIALRHGGKLQANRRRVMSKIPRRNATTRARPRISRCVSVGSKFEALMLKAASLFDSSVQYKYYFIDMILILLSRV